MCAVRTEETTTIRAQQFDHFLGSDRPLGDCLCLVFESLNRGIGMEILDNALA